MRNKTSLTLGLAALILPFSISANNYNDDYSAYDSRYVRGIEVTKRTGRLTLKGEGFDLSGGAVFRLATHPRKQERIMFSVRADSRNVEGLEDKLRLNLEGYEIRSFDAVDLNAGEYRLAAQLDVEAKEITEGLARFITVIEIR